MANLYNTFRNEKVLNLFTDASLKSRGKETDICYGCIAVCCDTIIDSDYKVNTSKTSNNGEAQGILLAIQFAIKYRDIYPVINIFSDSLITISNIRDRYMNWKFHQDNYINKSTGIVQNQSVFVHMMQLICDYDLSVNFFHQKGHVDQRKFEDVKHATDVFASSNRIPKKIDYAFIRYISNYNNVVDITSRSILTRTNTISTKYETPFVYIPTDELLREYKNRKLKEIRVNEQRKDK